MYRPSARAEVVAALLATGGEVSDSSGRASAALVRALELVGASRNSRNIASLLLAMERDNEIVRETAGRRTFTIELSKDVPARLFKAAEAMLYEGGWTLADIAEQASAAGLYSDYETMAGEGTTENLVNVMYGDQGPSGISNADRLQLTQMVETERAARRDVERERDQLAERVDDLEADIARLGARAELADQVSELFAQHDNTVSIDRARGRRAG